MADLEDFEPQITSSLERLEKLIKQVDKKEYSEKMATLRKCDALKRTIKDLIESYELEVNNLDKELQYGYAESLREMNKRLDHLKQEIEFKKSEGSGQNHLFGDRRGQEKNTAEMNAVELIELGDQTQAKGNAALDNIISVVEQGNNLADQINLELDKQIEQLDRMEQTVKDTQSVLKRANQLIRYFARQVYTDKIIMGLICCVVLAIVIIVIISALGYDSAGRFNVPDLIK